MRDSTRLRLIGRWAIANGYAAAYPTFEQADYGAGLVYGAVLFTGAYVQWRDLERDAQLGGPDLDDVPSTWRAVNRWAYGNGFAGGFPTFEQGSKGGVDVYGAWLLSRAPVIHWFDAPKAELDGYPDFTDPGACVRAWNRWALARRYYAGFPNFEQAEYNGKGVYGGYALQPGGYVTWRDIPERKLRVPVPGVQDMSLVDAVKAIRAVGLGVQINGTQQPVKFTIPGGGTLLVPFDDSVTICLFDWRP